MIPLLAALLSTAPAEQINLEPTDDIWIYEHASDQTSDAHMRVWGSPDGAVTDFLGDFSFSCVKFKLPKDVDPAKLTSAKLVVHSIPEVAWTAEASKAHPLQARRLQGDFVEQKWDISKASTLTIKAGDDEVYGFGSGQPGSDKAIPIEIDLLKGKANFREALKSRDVSFALTTAMSPQDAAGSLYKVFSRNEGNADLRPKLMLTFSD